jgi:hypothetical protein
MGEEILSAITETPQRPALPSKVAFRGVDNEDGRGEEEENCGSKSNYNKAQNMKAKLLDVIKWGLILIIAGATFYIVWPKYDFSTQAQGLAVYRYNKITGTWKMRTLYTKKWQSPESIAEIISKETKSSLKKSGPPVAGRGRD